MSGRERYDRRIRADELERGDRLHLTFMGGDDYVEVLHIFSDGKEIEWEADSVGGVISDSVPPDQHVWIKK